MIELMTATVPPKTPEPKGEAKYNSPGSFTLNVPSGVTKVHGVCISGGGSGGGAGGGGGGGGGILWFNNLAVKGGDVISVTVGPAALYSYTDGNPGSQIDLSLNGELACRIYGGKGGIRNTGLGGAPGEASAPGASPLRLPGVTLYSNPGSTGGKGNPAVSGGLGGNPGSYDTTPQVGQQSLYGKGGQDPFHGLGGKGGDAGSSSGTCTPGGVRLIWGPGRSFPNNAL